MDTSTGVQAEAGAVKWDSLVRPRATIGIEGSVAQVPERVKNLVAT